MQTANAWSNGDDFLTYNDKPDRPSVDAGHHGLGAGYRLYATADGWVFLAAITAAEFATFCDTAGCGELPVNELFRTAAARKVNDAALSDVLAGVFLSDTAEAWEARLTAVGVGCVRADGIDVGQFWASDPHVVSNGWSPEVDHARFGRLRRWGPLSTVDGPLSEYRGAPLAGEHTDALLEEIGCDAAEIAQLRADNIVSSESVEVDQP
jgi:crotonobetainyl-CoA:carnitine CoA-transferase CaiB-like acyl-CoA transferase